MYKTDWETACERMDAWWEGEVLDRCVISVTAPRRQPVKDIEVPEPPPDLRKRWLDPDYRLAAAEAQFARTFFGGEAFPVFWCNLGPGIAATFMGARPVFAEDTVWFDRCPIIDDWQKRTPLEYDPENCWWVKTRELTRRAAERAEGKYFTGVTDLGGNLDIVASLRGTERLLFDLIDNPGAVKQLVREVNQLWFRYFNELDGMVRQHMEGTSAWMNIWCRKRWYPLQCDFSAMISPRMFEEFVLPALQEQCRRLDYSIYHWDGPGQIPHLDLLLSIPELTGIQWTPGDGNPPMDDPKWLPLYKRIQAAGKNVVILSASPKKVEWLLSELSPRGLYIHTHCESEEEARQLLKDMEKWTARAGG